jgi:ribosomal protein S18 acetylase RimI-like enzyme
MTPVPVSDDRLAVISAIENHGFRSWPALRVSHHYGWELRLSPALASRRVNSLNAIAPEVGRFPDVLQEAVQICNAAGVQCHVRLQPMAGKEAQANLSARGLTPAGETTVKIRSLNQAFPQDGRVNVNAELTDEWLDTYLQADWHADGERPHIASALASVQMPQAFAIAYDEGRPCAVGRGAVANGWLGIYQIATKQASRRRGLGQGVVTALLNWGKSLSAENAYLQVVSRNLPARGLYRGLGFEPLYTYDYWTILDA